MSLLTVSIGAWAVGLLTYVLIAPAANGLTSLLIYGAVFSAIPAFGAFWIVLVPVFSVLRRRRASPYIFPAAGVALCVILAALLNSLPSTASGAFSQEAVHFYIVFGLVGLSLGGGYLWSHRELSNREDEQRAC